MKEKFHNEGNQLKIKTIIVTQHDTIHFLRHIIKLHITNKDPLQEIDNQTKIIILILINNIESNFSPKKGAAKTNPYDQQKKKENIIIVSYNYVTHTKQLRTHLSKSINRNKNSKKFNFLETKIDDSK